MADEHDAIGSVAEEAMKLVYALSTSAGANGGTEHICTNTWCPLCQLVNHVREHPEAIERVTQSAADLARSVLSLIEQIKPAAGTPPVDHA